MLTYLLFSLLSPAVRAQDHTEFDAGLYGGYFLGFVQESAPSSLTWGAHGTVQNGTWGGELALGRMLGPYDDAAAKIVGGAFDPRIEGQYYFQDFSARLRPFVGVGLGVYTQNERFSPFIDLGPSIEYNLLPVLDARADLRLRVVTGSKAAEAGVGPGVLLDVGFQIHNPRVQDADGDGVYDDTDGCRDQAEDKDGFADTDGCPDPDNDNDGVPDTTDQCKDLVEDIDGFTDTDGCPDVDNDNDGILDQVDQCRDQAEDKDAFNDADGCPDPDNDNDGVPDGSDKCPLEPETMNDFRDKDGCADEVPAEVRKFQGKIEGITFETGKATIKPESFKVLDSATAVLKQFEDVRIEVQGHTDDVGDDAKNLTLSQDRAAAVVAYFVSKGIAADRLVALGYGETKPVAPNDSAANRGLNRRVEFKRIQ